jgi:hypothetical protein
MKFRILIQKTISWTPHFKQKIKWIYHTFDDGVFQHSTIEKDYPGWEVSMFWPMWWLTKSRETH